jgi:hypothetical protein
MTGNTRAMNAASCDYERLYATGGLYDPGLRPSPPLGTWIANVDPPYAYTRPMPKHIFARSGDTIGAVERQYEQWNREYGRGPSSDLFLLENAVLFNRTLHVPRGNDWTIVYETDRPFEREFKTQGLTEAELGNAAKPRATDVSYFYLGTVGSENYAHWLVDDLTRARAARSLQPEGAVVFVLDAYFEAIDRVRQESLQALFRNDDIEIIFIEKRRAFFFERLYYVSPSSAHPFLKCPSALADLRETFRNEECSGPKRLFVGRKGLWRNCFNEAQVAAALEPLGFKYVVIDGTPFAEQVRLFSNAEQIVAVSGASMGNTLFTPSGARLWYLAGEGFIDPFYWDLAALLGHDYNVAFGEPWKPEKPTFSSFTLDPTVLDELVAALGR